MRLLSCCGGGRVNSLPELELTSCDRLQLAHNRLRSMPLEFTSCSTLKYLNLRDNRFEEIPKAVSGGKGGH